MNPRTFFLLTISNKYGDTHELHLSEDAAKDSLHASVATSWDLADPIPADRDTAIDAYYETHFFDEDWNIEELSIEGLPRDRIEKDREALDDIANMLRDPDWGVGMLEDIADIVSKTGRSTETEYMVIGPWFASLFEYDQDDKLHPTQPIDPELNHDELWAPKTGFDQRAYWKQTGDTLMDGYWTTLEEARVFTGDPGGYGYGDVDGKVCRIPTPAGGEPEPVQTWGRH